MTPEAAAAEMQRNAIDKIDQIHSEAVRGQVGRQ